MRKSAAIKGCIINLINLITQNILIIKCYIRLVALNIFTNCA